MILSRCRPRHVTLLDPSRWIQYDYHRRYYAEILFRWGLLNKRAEVLKFVTANTTQLPKSDDFDERRHLGKSCTNAHLQRTLIRGTLGFGVFCPECQHPLGAAGRCNQCQRKRAGIRCALCHITVRGLADVCLSCQHGGHSQHLRDWFSQGNTECPAGCGCYCTLACGDLA
jgi:hypothetical protein